MVDNGLITVPREVLEDLWKCYVPYMRYQKSFHELVLTKAYDFICPQDGGSWLQSMGVILEWSTKGIVTRCETDSMAWRRSRWWKSRITPINISTLSVIYDQYREITAQKVDEIGIAVLMIAFAYNTLNPAISTEAWFQYLIRDPHDVDLAFQRYHNQGWTWYKDVGDLLMMFTQPNAVLGAEVGTHHIEISLHGV